MAAIGVRELKAKAGEVLRRAERGERIVLTRRGRPVATIVAIADAEAAYERALEAIAGPMIEAAEADLAGAKTLTLADVRAKRRRN
jgi:prevent-host-death family protein